MKPTIQSNTMSERSALIESTSPRSHFSINIDRPLKPSRSRWQWCRRMYGRCSWGFLATVLWVVAMAVMGLYWSNKPAPSSVMPLNPRFLLSFPSSVHSGPITGRLLLCIAKKHVVKDPLGDDQPRFLIDDSAETQQVFGVDVWGFAADQETREINTSHAQGYPIDFLLDIPSEEYWIQGVLHPYVHYNRSDGQQLWLPGMNTFESKKGVLSAPGTLYSTPQLVQFRPITDFVMDIRLDQIQPPVKPLTSANATSQELLQHIRFRSDRLSLFWGTDVYLQAWVLLPDQFYHPSTTSITYPFFIYHTHYNRDFEFTFNSTIPSVDATENEWYNFYFYSNWTSGDPHSAFYQRRGIIVQLQHANPYYDDSYAVNSANIGPYGDAITYEFLPYLETRFRGVGKPWARTMYGGSTGGWESLAVQVFYPDEYNGCWSFCPDSFDFHNFQIVNLLDDHNAYYVRGDWTQKERGSVRDYLGRVQETMEEENHHERVLGSRGRSGGQWDAWQAVYSPVNTTDGYPMAIWDKETGQIDHKVVAYWEEHYDIRVKLAREWETKGLGALLVNKLHVYVGVLDSYYLNDGVYDLDAFLQQTRHPYYNGTVEYGVHDGKGYEHCWTGSEDQTLNMAWNTLNQRIIPKMIHHIAMTAPKNATLAFTTY